MAIEKLSVGCRFGVKSRLIMLFYYEQTTLFRLFLPFVTPSAKTFLNDPLDLKKHSLD